MRLREAARALAVGSFRTSADARLVVPLRLEHVTMSERRPDAIFIPLPNLEKRAGGVPPKQAGGTCLLMRYPRLGLAGIQKSSARCSLASAVADTIPVFGAKVPGTAFR